ncbi:glutamine-tRNA ligase [Dictyostelium discoideum AX4]|uniref:Probable glutamine--tRNA ligase n=1 Tax=Dictyostelium discoideum TaxID=44689 RepID=SYQ_DICDI|nr:glutamine-tRNA ligase [Dictyostelium discoideum AX4]P14325.2 RecName: Full=Probable glutamine--tRNA ligase; AltName: Full=Glutaminyl-tRNA synthetase; Short=GlnRS; AltName: Full=Vegetative-specific protein H4 [Dictyostelium discoideum]EAL62672.1 glutamine-tRNA ligase [Dictyostelium discoideum AX4]|eukprot:XP_636180.1 glutamine-tRNA ligase [Dictyostelium discoideum AX4]
MSTKPTINKDELVTLFSQIGLDSSKAKETTNNATLSSNLQEIIKEAGAESGCEKSVGLLLYTLATKYPANAMKHRATLVDYIANKKSVNSINLQACLDYLRRTANEELNVAEFEQSCGVGVVITREQVAQAVSDYINKNKSDLLEKRYQFNIGGILMEIKNSLKWANAKDIKEEVDAAILSLLGPKTDADKAPPAKPVKPTTPTAVATTTAATTTTGDLSPIIPAELKPAKEEIKFPDPSDNIQNTPKLLADHLKTTGGKIVTRFPPEPNGYLHIGHAKAMHLNFGYAKKNGGKCYLRFDDTNPEKENQEYIDSIIDSVKWLGHEPCEITYSSSQFDTLYEMANELIRRGYAYVCHQTASEISEGREKMTDSPYRNRTVEENLKLFEDMRLGKFEEGKAILRMKGDMKHPNPCMRDLIAYRIKYHHHPMSGDKWCIYPSYDYTHCLVDSIENITHSLCTLEFEIRRLTYNWLIDVLGLYRPVVWEYARLNLTHTVLSKRKIITLVQNKIVNGWDDPRLSTLNAFRRKGYTPEAINLLCDTIGVTRTNGTTISYELLELCCRQDLDGKATRAMAVFDPIKVVITNYPEDKSEEINAPNIPSKPEKGTHKIDFSRIVYIERSDFRMEDNKDFFGLAPGKEILLKYAYNIKCEKVIQDADGKVTELHVTYDKDNSSKKLKTIHWVSSVAGTEPMKAEVRLYEHLFKDSEIGDDWLNNINPNSLRIIPNAFIDKTVLASKEYDRYQFERVGYFVVDKDTTSDKMVFNRTVSLKENKEKSKSRN